MIRDDRLTPPHDSAFTPHTRSHLPLRNAHVQLRFSVLRITLTSQQILKVERTLRAVNSANHQEEATVWEVISAISGAISAICDIRGAGQHTVSPGTSSAIENRKNLTPTTRLRSFLLRSAGWWLTVLSYVCIEQPYGTYITDREYKELLGWIVAGPAFLIIVAGLDSSDNKSRTSPLRNHRTRTRV